MCGRIDTSGAGFGIPTPAWHSEAQLIYLTGGTTQQPRQVGYSKHRYAESVRVTQEILSAHGVQPGMSLVVGHPFDPWAIGGVFRDAALACGARVLPLGLSAGEPSLWSTLASFDPDVFCGSASLLVQWYTNLRKSGFIPPERQRIVFHAAEPLLPSVRSACSKVWSARVVNVYGMAEFDSIASEGLCGLDLILNPHRQFALTTQADEQPSPLAEGAEGELLIRVRDNSSWYRTRDLVRVLAQAAPEEVLWPGSWRIEHLGRTDNAMKLPDGSFVYAEQLHDISREVVGIEHLQMLLVRKISTPAIIKLMISHCPNTLPPSTTKVRESLLSKCFELADAVKHHAVLLDVSIVATSKLVRTERGKVKLFLEQTYEPDCTGD